MTQTTLAQRKHWTVEQYLQMVDVGLIQPDERVELMDGEILSMSPIGPYHTHVVNALNRLLNRQLADVYIVSIQNPIQLDDFSLPQPDVVVATLPAGKYAHLQIQAADVQLVIEVADSSLPFDRQEKLPRYAAAGIPEVWIINVNDQRIEQYMVPRGDTYRLTKILSSDETLNCEHLNLVVDVAPIFAGF